MAGLKVWLRAAQAQSFVVSVIPVLVGAAVAVFQGAPLAPLLLLLTLAGVLAIHAATNMSNDWVDYKTGVDNQPPEIISPFTAGSRVLPDKLLTPDQHRRVWLILYAIGAAIGLYLALTVADGWVILALGASMGLLSLFYTYPPLKLQYHGFGEALVGIIFGPVLVFGSYFVQAHRLDLQPLLVSVPFGIFVAAFLLVNEMPEWQSDPKGGKVTVPARVGLEKSMKIYVAMMVAGYAWIAIIVASGAVPYFVAFGFASLPLGAKGISVLRKDFASFPKHIPANASTLLTVLVTGVGLLVGYTLAVLQVIPSRLL
jgi:1,4-dihydroxy-2-naphthoate polyprenyltransferase